MLINLIHSSWTLLFVLIVGAFGVVAQDKRQAADCTNPVGPAELTLAVGKLSSYRLHSGLVGS